MGKIIDERFSKEYKGIMRTISLSTKNEIIIEYNLPFSSEIGHQFKKCFSNDQEIVEFVKIFVDTKTSYDTNSDNLEKIGVESNIKMMKDILNDNLPDLLNKFNYIGSKKDLKDLYSLILSLES